MKNNSDTIYVMTNSPGEISGWLKPLVRGIKESFPGSCLAVILLPCVFASGQEEKVLKSIPEVDEVIPASKYPLLLLGGAFPVPRMILHLGGEITLTALLAWRYGLKAWSYQWGKGFLDRFYQGYFVKSSKDLERLLREGISSEKIHVVGDLVVDSVFGELGSGRDSDPAGGEIKICFMPGSRLREVRFLIPFYIEIAERIAQARPDSVFLALISPYLPQEDLEKIMEIDPCRELGGVRGKYLPGEKAVTSPGGVRMDLVTQNHYQALASCNFVVTIPGTKTAEAACLGKPMLVILPLNRPQDIPYIGLVGLLDWLPGLGPLIKRPLILHLAKIVGMVAQPNILSGSPIVPELRGVLSPGDVAEAILRLISVPEELASTGKRLRELYAPFRGSAQRVIECLNANERSLDAGGSPIFSVIICTHNRKDMLLGVLQCLDRQDLPPTDYEVIVVDDGSTDGTQEAVLNYSARCPLRYIRRSWAGRAAARNCGLSTAKGEFVLFIDDDTLIPREFLREHLRVHRRFKRSIVRGPVIIIESYRFPKNRKAGIRDYSQAAFCTCNVSVSRSEIAGAGGFDESFREYGFEDNEMGWRLIGRGLRVRFNMGAIVYHYWPPVTEDSMPDFVAKAQELARTAVLYFRKHPHWKVRLATGIHPFRLAVHSIVSHRLMGEVWHSLWKRWGRMKGFAERRMYSFHYHNTLREELKKSRKAGLKKALEDN